MGWRQPDWRAGPGEMIDRKGLYADHTETAGQWLAKEWSQKLILDSTGMRAFSGNIRNLKGYQKMQGPKRRPATNALT